MNNKELVKAFRQLAIFLTMKDVPFKPYAYERAALGIETLDEDVAVLYGKGGLGALEKIPGVGKNISRAIEEFLISGEISQLSRMKKKIPVDLDGLMAVEGVGPKTIKELWQKLKVKNLAGLEKAAKAGRIRKLANFGEKSEKNILQAIAFVKKSKGRFLLGEILPEIEEIVAQLKKLKEVERIDIAGSLRRRKETIGDADILVISKSPKKVTDFFVSLPGVAKIWGQGATKSSIRMKAGFDIDLRVVPAKSYGAALQYFTGAKEHNIMMRKIAMDRGLKLNEYGLFKGKKMLNSADEKDIYKALGLPYIEPELREGGVPRYARDKMFSPPRLIDRENILGDLHCHSNWDGGRDSIAIMAEAARKMGYQYIGIADHTKFLRLEHGLNEKQLMKQRREIDALNTKYKIQDTKYKILHGCEANILNDGSIDIKDKALAKLDFVIAGIHSNMKMSREQMTNRIIKAMKNPNVDIIAHPTGRILKKRDEYQVDLSMLLKVAKETGTVLEINASPDRLDLNDLKIRQAKEMGVRMVINTDSHTKEYLRCMGFGVSQARRGGAEKKDIINCWPLKKLIQQLL